MCTFIAPGNISSIAMRSHLYNFKKLGRLTCVLTYYVHVVFAKASEYRLFSLKLIERIYELALFMRLSVRLWLQ